MDLRIRAIREARERVAVQFRAVTMAEEQARIARLAYREGVIKSVEAQDAELGLTAACFGLLRTRLDAAVTRENLKYALGEWPPAAYPHDSSNRLSIDPLVRESGDENVILVAVALAWAAYCAVHSGMISETVTGLLRRKLGAGYRFYRLFFNAVALLTLVPVWRFSLSVQQAPLFRWESVFRPVQWAMWVGGIALLVAGARHYSLMQFLGIDQLREAPTTGLRKGGGIDSNGVLGWIRHPWYTAVVLLVWARDLDPVRIVVNLVLTAYIGVGTVLEERKLVRELGDAYAMYRRRVSMFVPWIWLKARIGS